MLLPIINSFNLKMTYLSYLFALLDLHHYHLFEPHCLQRRLFAFILLVLVLVLTTNCLVTTFYILKEACYQELLILDLCLA